MCYKLKRIHLVKSFYFKSLEVQTKMHCANDGSALLWIDQMKSIKNYYAKNAQYNENVTRFKSTRTPYQQVVANSKESSKLFIRVPLIASTSNRSTNLYIEEFYVQNLRPLVEELLMFYPIISLSTLRAIDPLKEVKQILKHEPNAQSALHSKVIQELAVMAKAIFFGDAGIKQGEQCNSDSNGQTFLHSTRISQSPNQTLNDSDSWTRADQYNIQLPRPLAKLRLRNQMKSDMWQQIFHQCIQLRKEGSSYVTISRILNISSYHVKRLLNIGKLGTGLIVPSKRGRKNIEIKEQDLQRMLAYIENCQSTTTISQLQEYTRNKFSINLSRYQLAKVLKQKLGLTYHKVNHITPNHNSNLAKLQRQIAAKGFIESMWQGFHIINIDESIIQFTNNCNYSWLPPDQRTLCTTNSKVGRLCITAAASSQGSLYFSISQGYTNSLTFTLFLIDLASYLDTVNDKWREHTLFLFDNAPYHRSSHASQAMKDLSIPYMFLGPYQFDMAPVEKAFRYIKQQQLNPHNMVLNTRKRIAKYQVQLAYQISHLDMSWLESCYNKTLIVALRHLSLQNV